MFLLVVLICQAAFFFMRIEPVLATNLLTNPGFESGTSNYVFGAQASLYTGSQAHGGSNAGQFSGTSSATIETVQFYNALNTSQLAEISFYLKV
jgi:hypothetical protein